MIHHSASDPDLLPRQPALQAEAAELLARGVARGARPASVATSAITR